MFRATLIFGALSGGCIYFELNFQSELCTSQILVCGFSYIQIMCGIVKVSDYILRSL